MTWHIHYIRVKTAASLSRCDELFTMKGNTLFVAHFWPFFNNHAAGKCRRQVKNVTNLVKNVKIVEFHDNIWNPHEKYIEISTNRPGIGLLICEIASKVSEILESKHIFA